MKSQARTSGLALAVLSLCAGALAAGRKPSAPVALLHPPLGSGGPIVFIAPPEGLVLKADHDFVLGSVSDPKALFTINGQTVTVHKDGGFLAWLPVSAGTFTFHARLEISSGPALAERTIFVTPRDEPLPYGELAIAPSSLEPKEDLELREGDWWRVRMKASRGQRARFRVGSGPWRDLRDVDPRQGLYEAVLRVAPGETFGPSRIDYELGAGWSAVRLTGTSLVAAVDAPPAVAVVKSTGTGFVSLKIGPGEGFLAFPPAGTRFLETGRSGSQVRLALSPELSGWLDAKDVDISTGSAPPGAVSDNIGVTVEADRAVVRVPLSDRVPFTVDEDAASGRVTLRLYWTHGHTNWINYEGLNEFVREVSWHQEASQVMAVDIQLWPGERFWGWHAEYGGGSLRLSLRRAPLIDPRRPLSGLKIMLDPGHTTAPTDGATGPLGTREPTANYAIAQAVAARLAREGAVPLMSRASLSDDVPLARRPQLAVERGADLFVSIHNNALPDGSDPFAQPHGFMIFYYHPQSLDLARALHAAYVEQNPLADEGLKWGNLLVARLSDMPAVLIESTMMIFPDQEAMLNDPAFRDRLAKAMVEGLRSFALQAGRRPANNRRTGRGK